MKCPFCDSLHTAKNGFDERSMDVWKCLACGETFTQADLDEAEIDDRPNGEGNTVYFGLDDDDDEEEEIQEYDGRPIINRYNLPHDDIAPDDGWPHLTLYGNDDDDDDDDFDPIYDDHAWMHGEVSYFDPDQPPR